MRRGRAGDQQRADDRRAHARADAAGQDRDVLGEEVEADDAGALLHDVEDDGDERDGGDGHAGEHQAGDAVVDSCAGGETPGVARGVRAPKRGVGRQSRSSAQPALGPADDPRASRLTMMVITNSTTPSPMSAAR